MVYRPHSQRGRGPKNDQFVPRLQYNLCGVPHVAARRSATYLLLQGKLYGGSFRHRYFFLRRLFVQLRNVQLHRPLTVKVIVNPFEIGVFQRLGNSVLIGGRLRTQVAVPFLGLRLRVTVRGPPGNETECKDQTERKEQNEPLAHKGGFDKIV